MLIFEGYLSLTSSPNFFKSFAIFYFLNISEQLSAKNYKTPLFSIKSPYPLFFLDVEELKHFS